MEGDSHGPRGGADAQPQPGREGSQEVVEGVEDAGAGDAEVDVDIVVEAGAEGGDFGVGKGDLIKEIGGAVIMTS